MIKQLSGRMTGWWSENLGHYTGDSITQCITGSCPDVQLHAQVATHHSPGK